jgi:hypothetical protein
MVDFFWPLSLAALVAPLVTASWIGRVGFLVACLAALLMPVAQLVVALNVEDREGGLIGATFSVMFLIAGALASFAGAVIRAPDTNVISGE